MNRFVEKISNFGLAYLLMGIGTAAHIVGLKRIYQRLLANRVEKTGFFDEDYYRRHNPDVVKKGMAPLWHYVAYGDRERRQPMPLFDPGHYRRAAGRRLPALLNTILHYTLIGRYRGFATSPWFDTAHYLAANRDVKFNGMDPLLHFLNHGGREGRAPCAAFDTSQYLLSHPEVAEAGDNPLLHYLGQVQSNGNRNQKRRNGRIRPVPPGPDQWTALPAGKNNPAPVVDVIVPVYEGRAETLRCIFNVLRFQQRTPFELVVVDDASPDPVLSSRLRELAGTFGFTYWKNETNQGYVRTVNRAMGLNTDRDVVLLNADTEPYNDWLDRLRDVSRSDSRIGTVTPLSNNATICSYPQFDRDNPCPLELAARQLDRLAATVNADIAVETPTAVGFCMYIKRQCLNDIGLFDEAAFGRGYGEENDFCQRAIENQWKHVIASHVFVWHWGQRSFQGAKGRRSKKALKILARRYPHYRKAIGDFVARDPLHEARRRLDQARLSRTISTSNVLVVTHNRGGGTARSVRTQVARLHRNGMGVFFLAPSSANGLGRVTSVHASHLPNLDRVCFQNPDSFSRLLKKYRIDRIQVHQLVDFHPSAGPAIAECAKKCGVRLDVFIHDYQAICPHINMIDGSGTFCGEPDEKTCDVCLKKRNSILRKTKVVEIRRWRHRYEKLFSAAAVISVPDQDVKTRLKRWFPGLKMTVQPPKSPFTPCPPPEAAPIHPDRSLRIVVLGAIVPIKGFDVLAACAKDARQRQLPVAYTVMGYSRNDRLLKRLGVTVTGRYRDREGVKTLQMLRPDLVWLPSIWPETYSYTLSLAFAAGYDIAAFDIGAISRRLRSDGNGNLLQPLSWVNHPQRINNAFVHYRNGKWAQKPAQSSRKAFEMPPEGSEERDAALRAGGRTC